MNLQDLKSIVTKFVRNHLNANRPFTSACVSHPIIEQYPEVRHKEVNAIIKEMWSDGDVVGDDNGMIVNYNRSLITVYPDGANSTPRSAFCYHPSNFDPFAFGENSKVLKRPAASKASTIDMDSTLDDDTDDDQSVGSLPVTPPLPAHVVTGLSVDNGTKIGVCCVQMKSNTLNIPLFLVRSLGWHSCQPISLNRVGGSIYIRSALPYPLSYPNSKQRVDAEGRIRLYGCNLSYMVGSPTVLPGTKFRVTKGTDSHGDFIRVC